MPTAVLGRRRLTGGEQHLGGTRRSAGARGVKVKGVKAKKVRTRSRGLQATRVGVWFGLAGVVVVVAAINTGNNGLFLTVAAMTASLVVAQILSWLNLAHVAVRVEADQEIYANSPSSLEVTVRNRSRLLPSWLLWLATGPESLEPPERRPRRSMPLFVPFLAAGQSETAELELFLKRRGVRQLRFLTVSSLFPLGLFRKERQHPTELEILVYPEVYPASMRSFSDKGPAGDQAIRQPGLGHELHTLREYQPGDDPRSIHWKQSARQQSLIVQQRQMERSRRLRIIFDNAVGNLDDDSSLESFEGLVSEAASVAVEALDHGYEVALLSRDSWIDYGAGERQRRNVLEALACIDALPLESTPLGEEDEEKGLLFRLGPGSQATSREISA